MMLIAPDRRFLFTVVPKAANSTIKAMLWAAYDGLSTAEDIMRQLYTRDGPLLSPADMSDAELRALFHSPDCYRFTFVRNPYNRLISAYRDKILNVNHNHDYNIYLNNLGQDQGARLSFRKFVELVCVQADERADWHWLPQWRCTFSGLLHYEFIGKVENFANDIVRIADRLGISPPAVDLNRTSRSSNAISSSAGNTDAVYTADLADLVFRRFRRDFQQFGYDRSSWQDCQ